MREKNVVDMTVEEFKEELRLLNDRVINFKDYEIKVGRGIQRYGVKQKVEPVPSMLGYHTKRLRRLSGE